VNVLVERGIGLEIVEVADLWEENQEFLRQRLGKSGSTMFGARWILTPEVPVARFNHVSMVRLTPESIPDLVSECGDFFRLHGLPASCILTTPATQPIDLPQRLAGLGFGVETNPVMLWDGTTRPTISDRVTVAPAPHNMAGFVFWLIRQVFFPTMAEKDGKQLRHGVQVTYDVGARNFVAYIGEEPAGVVSLFSRNGMAGIYNMGTLHRFRGRRVAATLMEACLVEARNQGCRYVGLTPTPLGRPMYEKLGFHEVYLERYMVKRF